MNPLTGDWIDTAEELRNCAREIVVRPLRHDRMIRTLQPFTELICAVPSGRALDELKSTLPEAVWWVMDSEADYQALRKSLVSEEELIEEQ